MCLPAAENKKIKLYYKKLKLQRVTQLLHINNYFNVDA